MQVLPFNPSTSYFPSEEFELITLDETPYPDARRTGYRGKTFPDFDIDQADEVLGQAGGTHRQVVYIFESVEGSVNLAVIPGKEEMFKESAINPMLEGIRGMLLTLISVNTDKVLETGYLSRGKFVKQTKLKGTPESALKFINLMRNATSDAYQGNSGQLEVAEKLGEINLSHLYSLASGLGEARKREWTKLHVPFAVAEKFRELLKRNPDAYNGKSGQIKMAEELGKINLGNLYSLTSGLDEAVKRGWVYMNISYEVVGRFRELLKENPDGYNGNIGQIKMAEELGKINLNHLHSLASGLDEAKKRGWVIMSVPYEIVGKFRKLLEKNPDAYNGNVGQIKMAEELSKIHLSHLYSLASGLGEAEKCGWTKINTRYEIVGKFRKLLGNNPDDYDGNIGQLKMAEELGKIHLGQLYSLASGLEEAEKRKWSVMNITYGVVEKFRELLEKSFNAYSGNIGQIKMAEELGKINLGHLHGLASSLGEAEKRGWTYMNMPYERAAELLGLAA